VARKAS